MPRMRDCGSDTENRMSKSLKHTPDFLIYFIKGYDNNRLYILGFQRYLREKENKDVLPLCDLNIDIFNRYMNKMLAPISCPKIS